MFYVVPNHPADFEKAQALAAILNYHFPAIDLILKSELRLYAMYGDSDLAYLQETDEREP